jgi:hypothetical protein
LLLFIAGVAFLAAGLAGQGIVQALQPPVPWKRDGSPG